LQGGEDLKHSGLLFLAIPLVLAIAVRASASPGTIEDLLRDDGIAVDQRRGQSTRMCRGPVQLMVLSP
jgi:hypothetical protein